MAKNHKGMAGELARCKLRYDSEEDLGMSSLSLPANAKTSTRSQLHAILGCMVPYHAGEKTEDEELIDELSKVDLERW